MRSQPTVHYTLRWLNDLLMGCGVGGSFVLGDHPGVRIRVDEGVFGIPTFPIDSAFEELREISCSFGCVYYEVFAE